MQLQMQNTGISPDKTDSYYSIAAPSFFGDETTPQAQADRQTMQQNKTFIEERARADLADWFVGLELSKTAPELTLKVRKGAHRHAPDFAGFKSWLTSYDF